MAAPFASASSATVADAASADRITARVLEIIGIQVDRQPADLAPDAKLRDHVGCDDLDMIEIAIDLEFAFGIELTDEPAKEFATIGDVTRAVIAALAVANPE